MPSVWTIGNALHVTLTKALAAAAAVAAAGSVGFLGTPIGAADDLSTTTIGNEAKLTNGNVVQGWTISNLKTSTEQIPYPVAGTLWKPPPRIKPSRAAPRRSCRTSTHGPRAARPTAWCSVLRPPGA
jgi:hypothetical protein